MRKFLAAFGIIAIIGGGAAYWIVFVAIKPPPQQAAPHIVSIHPGESFASIARRLARAGVVRNAGLFIIYGEWTTRAAQVKPGDYAFPGGESFSAVLHHLVEGDFMTVTVAIPEGLTVHQIGQRLEAAGLACDNEFDDAALDGPLLHALGMQGHGAEGFLFPATYRFSPLAKTNDVLSAMLARFFALLTPAVEQRLFDLGLDARQMVTLASIIEREAKVPGERPVIASVFYNRLAVAMPLQADPTAQYNLAGESTAALTAVHTASAYNTYAIGGLPPGPIANPGLSSIEAVLYPAHTDYLYFVARDDGTHIFSRSLQQHLRAIAELKRATVHAHH